MMNFEDLFNNDYSESFYDESDDIGCDTVTHDHMLSPPISMPSTPAKYNQIPAYNDSDLRESNFLRRMQQCPDKEIECLSSNDFTIMPITVKTTVNPVSSVKVKLESVQQNLEVESDRKFIKRVNNRRAMKQQNQKRYSGNDYFFKTEQIEEELFKPISPVANYRLHPPMPSSHAVTSRNPNTDSSDPNLDHQLKFALKNMLPIPSNSEQRIILDEYNQQLGQFSIAINRIIKEEKSDDNCVYLLKLLAGMYTLLKTTLLNPPIYSELFHSIRSIESDAHNFIVAWSQTASYDKQVELFELGWWCESAVPRAYLVTLLYFSLDSLWRDPKYIADTFSVCKSIQHPLKGSFLYSRLHTFLKGIYNREEEMSALLIGYSVEIFTTLLRLFCRWHQSLPAKTTETSYIASLYKESFEDFFVELGGGMCSYDMFETVVLPTILTEVVNSGDLLAQTLIFTSLVKEFDGGYLLAQLDQLIKASSQFAQGIDLKMLLNQLFVKVQTVNGGNDGEFFETIWNETSKLIKNRCEIDQSDTVIISSLILSLISKCSQDEEQMKSIETVLEFLIKTLKLIRPEGFNSETSSVGKEIVSLIKNLMDEFDFEGILLRIEGLPDLLNCLTPESSRKCCLNQILPKLTELTGENVKNVMRLFGCLSKTDLVQLSDNNYEIETLKQVTSDLQEFSNVLISKLTNDEIKTLKSFFEAINSSSSCLNLFLLPKTLTKMLSMSLDESFYKSVISSMLQNTSTVLPQRLEESDEELEWIEPEFTKLMAVKMNLNVIEALNEKGQDSYEFYTEILNVLNNYVSQDNLKIQIIKTVLDSFNMTKCHLNYDDFKCLLDHLSKESCQLLRKTDRCTLLLQIIILLDNDKDNQIDDLVTKYIDQLIGLILQLPAQEDENKFEISCQAMEIIMKRRRIRSGNEEMVYQWMKMFVEKNPEKEMQFYSIKLKYDEQQQESDSVIVKNGNDVNRSYTTANVNDNSTDDDDDETNDDVNYHGSSTEMLEDDLQKLKIFESFQM